MKMPERAFSCYNQQMVKKPLIIANWKMNPGTEKEAINLFRAIKKALPRTKKCELVIAPPAIFLHIFKHEKGIMFASQEMSTEESGAFTGQISGRMLRDVGAEYVILGHSEQRSVGETNGDVARKANLALKFGLTPIICVGEHTRGESAQFYTDIKEQLRESIAGISKNNLTKICVAYEPVWAISTTEGRRDITEKEATEMILFVRKVLSEIARSNKLIATKVLYGGSVNDKNIEMFIHIKSDGFLVGGASLNSKKFGRILESLL